MSNPVLIWERLREPQGSRKLDYRSIVRAAVRLADREGLAAVSMRNVAAALGVGTMSLYRYVSGKDDLLDLLLDAAYGQIPLHEGPELEWRGKFTRLAIASRRTLKAHPWLAPLITQRPALGPNYLRWFEYLLAITAAPGRDIRTQVRMIGTVWSYITGFIAYELGEMEVNRRHRLTEAKKRRLAKPYVAKLTGGGQFPHLKEFVKSGLGQPSDEDFLAGLAAVLAGVAAL